MKRTLLLVLVIFALGLCSAAAQTTANGTLTVTATVNGSIGLLFNTDAAGPALSAGNGTNAATLPFGTIQAYGGTVPTGVTRTATTTNFTVTAPVDVNVFKCNSASANYSLTAKLGTADAVNSWTVGSTGLTTTAQSITTAGVYATSGSAQTIGITIPFTNNTGSVSDTIVFTATAN